MAAFRVVPLGGKDCKHEDGKICNGAIVKEMLATVQMCIEGKVKLKKKIEVFFGWQRYWTWER